MAYTLNSFDESYYLSQNPDVLSAVQTGAVPSAMYHYEMFGEVEGRWPSPFFDPSFYLSQNPDILNAIAQGLVPGALYHFENYGVFEGRAPAASVVFDETYYLANNPDVAAAVADGSLASGWVHWVLYGAAEGRVPAEGEPGGLPGDVFVLTTAVDNIVGTLNNDQVQGYINDNDNLTTVQAADVIDGSSGYDTLNVVVEDFNGSTDFVNMTNVEKVTIQALDEYWYVDVTSAASSIQEVEMRDSPLGGYSEVWMRGLNSLPDLTFTNVAKNDYASLSLEMQNTTAAGDLNVYLNNAGTLRNISGGGSSYSVSLDIYNYAGSSDFVKNLFITADGPENNFYFDSGTDGLEQVTIDGTGDYLEFYMWLADGVTVFDSSAFAGGISSSISTTGTVDATVTLGGGSDYFQYNGSSDVTASTGGGNDWFEDDGFGGYVSVVDMGDGDDMYEQDASGTNDVQLGAGDDNFDMRSGWQDSKDTIVGGDGTDTLISDAADYAVANALKNVSGFERLGVVNGTYDAGLLGLSSVLAGGDFGQYFTWSNNATYWTGATTVNNLGAGTELIVNRDGGFALTLDLKSDTAGDSLAVDIANTGGNASAGLLTADDFETINITSSGKATAVNTIAGITSGDLKTVTIAGDVELNVSAVITAANLSKIDASALDAKLTFAAAPATASSVQFFGGSKVDTYIGSANGDVVNAGAGADVITLTGVGVADTVVLEAGDSLAGKMDSYAGFEAGAAILDSFDVGSFGFTGTQASALASKGTINPATFTPASTVADFFSSGGFDRGVAFGDDGADTYVFVDADKNGDFDGATDLMVKVAGVTAMSLNDFGF